MNSHRFDHDQQRSSVQSLCLLVVLTSLVVAVLPLALKADPPQWWLVQGVIDVTKSPNDYDAVNQGQVKFMAEQAAALGFYAAADGTASLAVGNFSHANGTYSTALSSSSVASGDYSVAAGRTEATSLYQFAVGRYGQAGGNATTWVATDDLFTVGNGQTAAAPSNALAVKKNGDTTIGGKLTVAGPIIVQQQGDLSMGEFTAQPSPTP